MTPARHVRLVLEEAARRGDTFPSAWDRAMRSLPRPQPGDDFDGWEESEAWKTELRAARPAFAESYAVALAKLRAPVAA